MEIAVVQHRTTSLPFMRQLVPLDGTAMWMINLAEKQNIFVWVGVVASISLMLIGFLAFTPALDTITFVRAINLIAGTTAACAVGDS